MIHRRSLISLLGGAAAAWPLEARGQQPTKPTVGLITAGSAVVLRRHIAAFREGVRETGHVEGQNVAIELRSADGQFDRFPALVSELVRRQVAVLAVTSTTGARAAKQGAGTIPIVFSIGEDPVATGIVNSINRPSGNITGVYQFTAGLEAKRLGLLHEMVPKATIIAVLINTNFSGADTQLRDVKGAAARLGVQLLVLNANVENELDAAFAAIARRRAGALHVCGSPFFNTRREQLVVLAARHAVPAIYEWRDFAMAGGLMSYGTDLADAYRQAGVYAGLILKGAKPTDLPVMQSTKFEFVINLSTAKALGIDVPPTLLARADQVME
jgi:putative ABC transport system substrate-binding protein